MDNLATTMTWREISEDRYDEMLGMLPPASHRADGFLLGEQYSHRLCTVTGKPAQTWLAFVTAGGRFFEGSQAITTAEFRAVNPHCIHVAAG